jgi:Uma2 family endonuclease
MNVHTTAPTDPDAFLRWNEGREGKRELVNGKVVEMMTGGTRRHAILMAQLLVSLRSRVDRRRFLVLASDLGVKTAAGVRYPDVLVERKGGGGTELAATAPVLISEILSLSSRRRDLEEKAWEYTGLPGLQAYLILAQDELRAWLWVRDGETWTGPADRVGLEAVVDVPALSAGLPLAELYQDLLEELS